jgi:meso-butanediol dehydrogenase/(S,S)-butanediol dehydrogenase/diacetyl reductase
MSSDLTSKVAIVTGAGSMSGLGHAIAIALAGGGATVVVHDVTSPDESTAAVAALGGRAASFASDLAHEKGMSDLIDFAVSEFGRLDILVNNAGLGHLCGPLVDFEAADWDRLFAINLRACFFGVKHAARQMQKQNVSDPEWGRGRIVSIASQAAKTGFALHAAYSATKHGLLGLTRAAAVELGPDGITVNAVCPNHMDTALGTRLDHLMAEKQGVSLASYRQAMVSKVPLGRLGSTADTAGVCAFLCSRSASYITGESWNVSGGEEYH